MIPIAVTVLLYRPVMLFFDLNITNIAIAPKPTNIKLGKFLRFSIYLSNAVPIYDKIFMLLPSFFPWDTSHKRFAVRIPNKFINPILIIGLLLYPLISFCFVSIHRQSSFSSSSNTYALPICKHMQISSFLLNFHSLFNLNQLHFLEKIIAL